MFDGKTYGEGIVELVKGYVERELAALKTENENLKVRLQALEDRPAPEAIKGDPGDSVDPAAINEMVDAAVGKAVAEIPVPENGKDAAGIVEALKDSGELVLTLQDGRLIRTGIRDGEKGKDAAAEEKSVEPDLTEEEKTAIIASTLRKELGDSDFVTLPEPLPVAHSQPPQSPVHLVIENHMPKRGVEKTVVTKHDERGRIVEFERREG